MLAFLAPLLIALAPAAPPLTLACHAEGLRKGSAVTAEDVCARLKAAVAKRLGKRARLATTARDSIRITVRFPTADSAAAILSVTRRGRTITHPELWVSVSDRAIGPGEIDQLARDVAARLNLQ